MAAKWIKLDFATHGRVGWSKFSNFGFAARQSLCPVLMAELTHVLPYYVLTFVPVATEGRGEPAMSLVAMLGLQAECNIYLDKQGKWVAPYVPSEVRGYPFALVPDAEGQPVLAVDFASGLLHDPAGAGDLPLFAADGSFAPEVSRIREFHLQRLASQQLTNRLVEQLQRADLIRPWSIPWHPDPPESERRKSGRTQRLEGCYQVDEETLRGLKPEILAELAHTGALGLAYAQIFSRTRLADLQFRHDRRHVDGVPGPELDPGKLELDKLFADDRDDVIKF